MIFVKQVNAKWNVGFESGKYETWISTCETDYLEMCTVYIKIVKYVTSKLCHWNRSYLWNWLFENVKQLFKKSAICYFKSVQLK